MYGIVPFRLPTDVALWEVEQVRNLGVRIHTGIRVGRDVSPESLVSQFDAVLLAFGMGAVPNLGIPGEELEGVHDAIEFIERTKTGKPPDIGDRVIIIGAGNTAIDAATCSRRLGAERVTLYYRRTEAEMTAYPFEFEFAKQEGVEFRWLAAPVRILGENGKVRAVEFMRMRLEHVDESGRPRPVPVRGSEFTVEADAVIRAIGQTRHAALAKAFGVETDHGVIRVDEHFRTTRPRVFAAGDCIFGRGRGEAMVVEAAEQGKRAARAIDRMLRQEGGHSGGGE
jgi:glutamate synthase (NADPH/NADH) small chain